MQNRWRQSRLGPPAEPAAESARAVDRLLRAGATLVGKTITDELAFSLEGENEHHGTPVNQRAPDRLPGCSSNGSAEAVAAGLADLGLGTDTGGSVRVPAAFCGLFGWRHSHGRVSMDGVVRFAPSYDRVGLLVRNAEHLQFGAQCLLGTSQVSPPSVRLLAAVGAFALAEPEAAAVVLDAAREIGARDEVGATIKPRFDGVRALDPVAGTRWNAWRDETTVRVRQLLPSGTFLVLLTAPSIAPLRTCAAKPHVASKPHSPWD